MNFGRSSGYKASLPRVPEFDQSKELMSGSECDGRRRTIMRVSVLSPQKKQKTQNSTQIHVTIVALLRTTAISDRRKKHRRIYPYSLPPLVFHCLAPSPHLASWSRRRRRHVVPGPLRRGALPPDPPGAPRSDLCSVWGSRGRAARQTVQGKCVVPGLWGWDGTGWNWLGFDFGAGDSSLNLSENCI